MSARPPSIISQRRISIANSEVNYSGRAGAGGSLYITTNALSGAGQMSANSGYYGGGGGRIAVLYGTNSGFDFSATQSHVQAHGYYGGGVGTIFIKSATQGQGELQLDNVGNDSSTSAPTVVAAAALDKLVVTSGARVLVPNDVTLGGLDINGAVNV